MNRAELDLLVPIEDVFLWDPPFLVTYIPVRYPTDWRECLDVSQDLEGFDLREMLPLTFSSRARRAWRANG